MSEEIPSETQDPHVLFAKQKAFLQENGIPSLEIRQTALERLEKEIKRRSDDLLTALATDLSKPDVEAYTSEVFFLLSEIRYVRKYLPRWTRPRRTGNPFYYWPIRSEIRPEPFGQALIVAPWNYPVQLALGPFLAAIAAGNAVILKPSELAPASAQLISEIVESAFEPGHAAVVQGGPDLGKNLLRLPFDFWLYTGSERIGRLYAEAAASHLAPIVLELGGKCPCVLDSDLDLERAAERIIATKFFNAGQTCLAPDFVLIPESRHDEFVDACLRELRQSYGDDASRDMASLVHSAHYERIRALIPESALRIGSDDPGGNFLAPALLPRASWEDDAMQEEIFGPVLPIVPYRSLDETLSELAERPAPLALYAFSRRREFLETVAGSIRSGSVCFNDTLKQATNLELPFGGVGESGMGRYRGRFGFDAFSYQRAVSRRWFNKDPFLVRPPYDGALEKLRKILK